MNILIISTTFIPSVILCGHSQLDYLEKQGKLNYQFVISHFVNKKNVEWADIIVFLRSDSDIDAYVSKIAKRNGKHLVYVLDDDILNVPSYISSAPYYLLPSTQNNIKTIMSNCDTFLTSSPVLLEKYGKDFKNSFLIDEASLNSISKKEKNEKIKIGFAGSIDRAQDLNEILEDAITTIYEKYGNSIEIEIMGAKPTFVNKLGLTHLPYQDGYDAYTAFMSRCNWDIGLAPMPDSKFHECKYFNKYIEYASFGIAGIYSNLKPYTFAIKDEYNGLLVNNDTDSWVEAISRLIDDEQLRRNISDNCLKEAKEKYSLDIIANDYLDKITYGYKETKNKSSIPDLSFVKSIIFFKRVYRKVKEQGLNFPKWLKDKLEKKYREYSDKKRNLNNLNRLYELLNNKKCICIISPLPNTDDSEYIKRVNVLDEVLKDSYKIYLSGEDRLCELLQIDFIDEDHCSIVYNSYDINQTNEVLKIIGKAKHCLIHSVIRFMREKISSDMLKLFELDDVTVLWDTHGRIPEEYEKQANKYTAMITNQLEEFFYNNSDVLICENDELITHFKNKYNNRDMKYIVLNNINDKNKLKEII